VEGRSPTVVAILRKLRYAGVPTDDLVLWKAHDTDILDK
jgi:hypothetical protein